MRLEKKHITRFNFIVEAGSFGALLLLFFCGVFTYQNELGQQGYINGVDLLFGNPTVESTSFPALIFMILLIIGWLLTLFKPRYYHSYLFLIYFTGLLFLFGTYGHLVIRNRDAVPRSLDTTYIFYIMVLILVIGGSLSFISALKSIRNNLPMEGNEKGIHINIHMTTEKEK